MGNILDTGYVDDHHIADVLPVHQHNQAPESILGVAYDGNSALEQHTVDDDLPNPAENYASDEIGHEENRSEQVGSLDLACQQQREKESTHIDGDHRDDGELDRKPQR
ncbi:hypothetical protein SDC9_97477 [bioreactor metagenome]|uniref:Uncharacterized protein n=1 Tax=bioreactor metagenome TaxID=1076179 RepID=A0A645AM85_9ZZZZ